MISSLPAPLPKEEGNPSGPGSYLARLNPSQLRAVEYGCADLMNLVRDDQGLSRKASRFPKKGTCFAIYSHAMNSRCPVEETLERAFPWCSEWAGELKRLFGGYVEAKQQRHVLDFDDLL